MSTPIPWTLAQVKQPKIRRRFVYMYDPYNFPHETTTNGTNPTLMIPECGRNAAGATNPNKQPILIRTDIIVSGTEAPIYGNNFGEP